MGRLDSEGPIAYTGAAIGSNVGKWLGLDNDTLKTLVGCGTSAGIAGIFIAPVGGILFGLEVSRIVAKWHGSGHGLFRHIHCSNHNRDSSNTPFRDILRALCPLLFGGDEQNGYIL